MQTRFYGRSMGIMHALSLIFLLRALHGLYYLTRGSGQHFFFISRVESGQVGSSWVGLGRVRNSLNSHGTDRVSLTGPDLTRGL